MTTANEYREYAHECIEGARTATTSEPVRKQFLDLAKLWLAAAERMDSRPGLSLQPEKLDGEKPPGSVPAE